MGTPTEQTRSATGQPYAAELTAEREGWRAVERLVRSITAREGMVPGYFRDPDWTVRDLVAHLGAWVAEAGMQLERIIGGTYEGHEVDIDAMNATFLTQTQDLPWDIAWPQASAARTRLLQAWADLPGPSDEAAWWIRKAGGEHYADHLPRLEEWVAELISQRT